MNDLKIKAKRILVVDDEEVIRRLLARLFANSGYELMMSGSIKEGFTKIAEQDFHLLGTDLRFPDGNGVELIRRFKEKFPSNKIIVMTGSLTPANGLVEELGIPALECLPKPFELDVFRRTVLKALGDL